jgi:CRP-like cAMP-binding protein
MPTAFGSRFAAQRAELLKRVANTGIFKILSDNERHDLLIHGIMHNFNDGDVIFEEDSTDEQTMYFIVSGEVDILLEGYKKEGSNVVATLSPGEIFGEMSMFNNEPRSATIRAKGLSTLLQLDLNKMMNNPLSNPSPDLAIKILCYIAEGLCNKLSNMNKVILHTTAGHPND